MSPTRVRSLWLGAPALAFFGMTSCMSTAKTESMVPDTLEVVRSHRSSIRVSADGTGRRMGLGSPLVTTQNLQDAIEQAIRESGVFAAVQTAGGADYELHASVIKLTKPEPALDMTAHITMSWTLRAAGQREEVWSDELTTSSRSTTTDTKDFQERGRFAIEGAVRNNIARALERLSRLEL